MPRALPGGSRRDTALRPARAPRCWGLGWHGVPPGCAPPQPCSARGFPCWGRSLSLLSRPLRPACLRCAPAVPFLLCPPHPAALLPLPGPALPSARSLRRFCGRPRCPAGPRGSGWAAVRSPGRREQPCARPGCPEPPSLAPGAEGRRLYITASAVCARPAPRIKGARFGPASAVSAGRGTGAAPPPIGRGHGWFHLPLGGGTGGSAHHWVKHGWLRLQLGEARVAPPPGAGPAVTREARAVLTCRRGRGDAGADPGGRLRDAAAAADPEPAEAAGGVLQQGAAAAPAGGAAPGAGRSGGKPGPAAPPPRRRLTAAPAGGRQPRGAGRELHVRGAGGRHARAGAAGKGTPRPRPAPPRRPAPP